MVPCVSSQHKRAKEKGYKAETDKGKKEDREDSFFFLLFYPLILSLFLFALLRSNSQLLEIA
jgi:hypothetical protein